MKDIVTDMGRRQQGESKSLVDIFTCAIITSENISIKDGLMQPEQMRAARALLNWSLDRLAQESGVHRNTLSNFETRKYDGDPNKVAAARKALRAAGVLFIDEDAEAGGVRQRRYRVGDKVRFRRVMQITDGLYMPEQVGMVVQVEPHPPAIGPTYRIAAQFDEEPPLALIFQFEFELVDASPIISLSEFVENNHLPMIPNGHFAVNPAADVDIVLETDLEKLPKELRSWIIVSTADDKLLNEIAARGFWPQESSRTLHLLWRQFPDGVLRPIEPMRQS